MNASQQDEIRASQELVPAESTSYPVGSPKRYPMLANADKATKRTLTKVLDGLKSGLGLATAASLAGISQDTLANWRNADSQFSEDVEEAAASFIASNVAHIQGSEDWKAKAWLLKSSPVSKSQWGEAGSKGSGGVTVVLNIDREQAKGITIEHE